MTWPKRATKCKAWFLSCLKSMYSPSCEIGNKANVLKPGESDPDEVQLVDLNKSWRKMHEDDPWQKKLMTHVRLLACAMVCFLASLWFFGSYTPFNSLFTSILAAIGIATITYWIWAGIWHFLD